MSRDLNTSKNDAKFMFENLLEGVHFSLAIPKHINRAILFFILYPLLSFYTNHSFIFYQGYACYIHILSAYMND